MNRTASRRALGLAAVVLLAGCSDAGNIFAPALMSPETTATDRVASFSTSSSDPAFGTMSAVTYTEVWDGRGTDSEACSQVDGDLRPPTGWIHWVFSTKGSSTDAELTLSAGGSVSQYSPGPPLNAEVWHFYTPFYDLDTLEAEIVLFGGDAGPGGGLVISDFCPGQLERLEVKKTAHTTFTREYDWSIHKSVATENGHKLEGHPKIWLYTNGSGDETATWTVDVKYKGYQDRDWNVSGHITIRNTGAVDAVITSVDDVLAGTPINVSCGVTFPYTLPTGETLTCSYSEDGYVVGKNVVTVTTERDTYGPAEADIVWGAPTTEINKTVNISDRSDLFGEVALGTATAPNNARFTYTKDFAWADFGADKCGSYSYDNRATIVETGASDDATLKVNVQCFLDETAYAKGDEAECFVPTFSNWGWTNKVGPGTHSWDLWAGAAGCDTGKGTLVGSVTVKYDGWGIVTVHFDVDPAYGLLESHVYAGTTKFPKVQQGRRLVDTVAPGQYTNTGPFDGRDIWVIAHAVVGFPDPDFGP